MNHADTLISYINKIVSKEMFSKINCISCSWNELYNSYKMYFFQLTKETI